MDPQLILNLFDKVTTYREALAEQERVNKYDSPQSWDYAEQEVRDKGKALWELWEEAVRATIFFT